MAKAPKQKIPAETRRLTKTELARLGLKLGSKRRVAAHIKRPTKRTKTFSDRAVAQAKIGTTKEKHALKARTVAYEISKTTHYNSLSRAEFKKLLKKFAGRTVVVNLFGVTRLIGERYEGKDAWVTAGQFFADDVWEHLSEIEDSLGFDTTNRPKLYGLIIRPAKDK